MDSRSEIDFKNYQQSYFNELAADRASKPIHMLPRFERFFANDYVAFMDEWVRAYSGSIGGKLVLDLGSGTGRYAQVAMSSNEETHVICADISFLSLQQARAQGNRTYRQSFVVCDAEHLPFRGCTLDGVMALMILHHLPGFLTLTEAFRVLKPRQELLVAEMVTNNPVRQLMTSLYSWLPRRVRASVQAQEDITVSDGRAPATHQFTSQRLLAVVEEAGFQPSCVEFHSLFLFVLQYLAKVLPFVRRMVSQRMLEAGHRLERWLLRRSLPSKLACIVVCRCQKEEVVEVKCYE